MGVLEAVPFFESKERIKGVYGVSAAFLLQNFFFLFWYLSIIDPRSGGTILPK